MTMRTAPDGFQRRPGCKAAIYARQSSPDQVENNKGSRAHQLGQREVARELGYPDDLIDVYEDAGLTGSAAGHRPEYQRLLADMKKGLIDLVIASDASRLSRDAEDWLSLLYTCAIHDVQLLLDGKVVDPKQGDERFVTGVIAMAAEYDNWRRSQSSMRARRAKLKQGKAVTTPPAGYVWGPDGTWLKDDRPGVQDSIEAQYRALREGRSLVRGVALLNEWGVMTPGRRTKHGIGWSKPSVSSLARFVHHPAYAGDATYGRRRGDPTLGRDPRGHFRSRRVPDDEVFVIADHHEPYISRSEQQALKAMLKRNAFAGPHGILGHGQALAQGVVRCGKHREWSMAAVWKETYEDGRVRFDYVCSGGVAEGKKRCGSIPGWVIDKPLLEAVVERLRPHALDELGAAIERAEDDARSESRRQRDMQHRLRREIEDLELRAGRVDPKHWTVVERYHEQLHQKNLQLRRLAELACQTTPKKQFANECLEKLRAICTDLDGLVNASTTEPRDRKELTRTMVDRVVVDVRTRERVCFRIVWNDGAPVTACEVLLYPYGHRVMAEWAADGVSPEEIAARLNEQRVVTKYHTPWTAKNVVRQLARMSLHNATNRNSLPQPVAVAEGR